MHCEQSILFMMCCWMSLLIGCKLIWRFSTYCWIKRNLTICSLMFYSKIMFQYLCPCVNFIIKRAAINDCSGLSFNIYRYKVIVFNISLQTRTEFTKWKYNISTQNLFVFSYIIKIDTNNLVLGHGPTTLVTQTPCKDKCVILNSHTFWFNTYNNLCTLINHTNNN